MHNWWRWEKSFTSSIAHPVTELSSRGQANWKQRDENGYLPAPPHDETGHTWHHPDEQLFEITKIGTEAFVGMGYRSNMIGFEDQLSDSEIWAVLAFIKSEWSPRIQRAQPK